MGKAQRFIDIVRERGIMEALDSTKRYLYSEILRYSVELKYGKGTYIMEEDWDNLILLDACRHDYFKESVEFVEGTSRKTSRAHESWGFMKENFHQQKNHDTVYVTANPYAERLNQNTFYTVESLLSQWDSDTGTVLPETVTEAAIQAEEEYPNKRLIIHYMQPHTPHLGDTSKKYNTSGWDGTAAIPGDYTLGEQAGESMFSLYENGHISREELVKSYKENINIIEPHIKHLLNNISGKTVISADHGENLGEKKYGKILTGHTYDSEETRIVPWVELPFDERKKVIEESPIGFESLSQEYIQDRLRDLGYV